jgi:hypothetical protein
MRGRELMLERWDINVMVNGYCIRLSSFEADSFVEIVAGGDFAVSENAC